MGKKNKLALRGRKRRKAPIVIIVVLIVAAVAAIASFLIFDVINTPNTLSEKLTRVLNGKAYDEIDQYYMSSDGSQSLGYSWKDEDRNRFVFFENGTGYMRFHGKDSKWLKVEDGDISGLYGNVVFATVKSGKKANWNNVVNKTEEMRVEGSTFTVESMDGGSNGKITGKWSGEPVTVKSKVKKNAESMKAALSAEDYSSDDTEWYAYTWGFKDPSITDGKTVIHFADCHRADDKRRVDYKWSIDESSKVLTLKIGKQSLVYKFVDDPSMNVKSEFGKEAKSKWIVTDKNFAINGMVYSAPDKATFWSTMQENFNSTFIVEDRWQSLLSGLGITLLIALCSTILGLLLGFLIAMVRSTYDMTLKGKYCYKFGDYVLKGLNGVSNVYITVIRGTPVVVQLMIMYFIIFASWDNAVLSAILAFGINSGAYVAEIVRSGIMSIDKGQFEASRSLGFDYKRTMVFVILPQALKNVLPALGNEFIVLLKETSVAGYAAIVDLTKASDIIRSRTYEPFFPLITIAVIYLILVLIISFFLKKLERRLRNSDH